MITLLNTSLVALGNEKYRESNLEAIKKSCTGIIFGAVKNIVDEKYNSLDEYSRGMLYDLTNYVDTPFAITVQRDGMILRPELWTDEFFNYDYIGAPWVPDTHFTAEGKEVRVGNGGFSFRSKKLLDAFNVLKLEYTDGGKGFFNEDGQICVYYRKQLEDYGIKFAPVEVAARFSTEFTVPESTLSFGGHRFI